MKPDIIIQMKRVSLFISIFLLSAISLYAAEDERAPYAPHEILVKLKKPEPTAVTSISKEEAKYVNGLSWKLKNKERLTVVRKRKISINNIYHLTLSKDDLINSKEDAVQKAVKIANSDPKVQYAEPNYILHANKIPNDPKFNKLWGLHNTGQEIGPDYDIITGTPDADIDAPEAWDIINNASEIIVAVIDTGVDYTHEDLSANMWTNSNGEHGYDYANDDTDPIDDNGHGTHVAGTIGAVGNNGKGVTGICWNVKIMAVKFLSGNGTGYTSDAIDGIIYAVNNGARILSNSWGGGGDSQALKGAIEYANSHNVLFVAAAGNDGLNTDENPHYPSCYDVPNLISVAATNLDDGLADEINDYYSSNYGKDTVDLAAPGVRIGSTYPGNRYVYDWGTSMATPHVSGAAALVWAKNPTLSNIQVKDIILGSVDTLSSLRGKVSTGGRLNILKALRQVPEPPVTDPSPQPDPDANVIFSDDMEGGPSNWSAQSPWSIVSTGYNSSHSWHDSPDGNYGNYVNANLYLRSINLSNQTFAMLTFWHKYMLEEDWDYGYVYISIDNGVTWTLLKRFNGYQSSWIQENINLSSYCGFDNVKIRFELVTDYSITCDGWYIDDVEITGDRPPVIEPNILIEPSSIPMVEVGNNGTTTQTFLIKNIGNEVLTYTIAGQNTNGTAILNPCEAESNPEQETQTLSINDSQWQIIRNEKTGTIHRAWRGNLSFLGLDSAGINAEALENISRDFIADNYALFKISESDLILLRNEKHSHQWYITFQQKYNDIPVHNAKIELRYSDINGRLTLFGSDAHPDINVPTTPSITEEEAQEIVKGDAGSMGAEDQLRTTQLLILPIENHDNIEYYLAYKVILFTKYPPHTWLYFINAIDGSIIMKRDVIKDAEISGHVRGGIYPLYPTDSEIPEEFPNQQIDVSSAGSDITDVSGYYSVSVSDSDDHDITARMSGPNLIVWNYPGYTTPYASYTGKGNISSPHHIEWNDSNSNAAERNIFYHTQVGYIKIKEIDPGFTGVDYQAEAWANITDYSNAYFDGHDYGYGDGNGGGDWPNFGLTSEVMYHEYGHGIMHFQYNEYWGNTLEFDSLHEGFADYFACTITDEPLIGEERGPGYPVLRNLALLPKATPSNTEPECHKRGQVISGALWDLRGVLGAELTDHLFHFARYGHGITFYDYYIDFLLEDDDDGDWGNGTPHSQDIYNAFAPHDIAYVNPVEPNDNIAPSVTNNLTAINSNYNSVTLTWTAPGDDGNSGRAHSYDIRYSISPITNANWSSANQLNGEPYPDSPGAAETVTVLGLESNTPYYFALRARDNRGNWSPLSNVTARTTGNAEIIYSDDMEGDTSGWTTNGSWGITSGGYNSEYCWTDTPGGNYGNNANYILTSPTFNLTDSQNTTLNFWHKYNLEEGYDWGHIEITTNGGLTWEIIKTYSGQAPNWANSTVDLSAYDGQGSVKLRFRLYSDISVRYDGWYIDDIKIMSGSGSGPADWLTFEPASGSIAPGAEEIITLSYDATGLPAAIYVTSLYITSNDSGTPNIALSVSMVVDIPPGAPTGLTAVPGDSKVDLSWNPNLEPDLAGYNVYRKIVSGHSASIRTTGMPVCDIQAKLSESLYLVKIFLTGELNIDVLLNLNLSIYENMGNYAVGEVTNSELDVLSDNGFTYVILDTDSQSRQYYTVWAPTQEILETINQYATVLETDTNTAIIHTDEQTAEEIPLHGFQIRPIRRSPLVPGEKTIVSYGVFSVNISKHELIQEMVAKVDESSVRNYIQTLQDFDTRYTYTSGYDNSVAYTLDKFRKMGLQAEEHQFIINGHTKRNVVATLTGKTKPNEIFIICGHLDCISDDKWNNAPGAEDNASGSSTVLEAARILSQYEFDSTIKFILFGGEEQGLYGSYYYAKEMADKGINIAGVLNFDMIAYLDTPTWDLSIVSHPAHQALAETVVYSANTYTSINAINRADSSSSWSDHWYFWQRGYPAICGIEEDTARFYPWYHTTNDTIDKISTSFAAEVSKLGIATLAELASPVLAYEKINNTLVTTTIYKDSTVTNDTTYKYVVSAVDNAGNESNYSNEVSATPEQKPAPKPQPPKNLAPLATATASSEYSSVYRAGNAVDGIIGAWDQGEWAAQGSWDRTPSLKLKWSSPQTINKIVIYGRPNKYDGIQNAKITLSNGASMTLGEVPIGGAAKTIYFTPADITWLEFKVLETNAWNPGLTEIEVYYEPKTQDNSNIALSATASASSEYSAQYRASNAIDGIIGQWDTGEWAARGSWDRRPFLKLKWSRQQTVNKIVIYGRPNKYDSIQNARITLSNGYSITLGEIPIGGAAKVIYFPAAQITWLEFKVLETNAWNPGLTEIEVYYEPPGTNTSNIARQSSVTVSSEYSSAYSASNAIDGIIGAWDQGEWASQGSWDRNPWLKLSWSSPQTVNKVVIYGRPNKYDGIQNARIVFSNGYSITLGEIPIGGAAKEIYFPTMQIRWLKFKVLETSAWNAGLTEIEVYYVQDDTSSSYIYTSETSKTGKTDQTGKTGLTLLSNPDTDGDGIYDKYDAFDLDPAEWEDTDGDGLGNNMDWDDDDDEVLDEEDAYPLDIKKSTLKNTPAILIKEAGPYTSNTTECPASNIDSIFLTIPEETDPDDIKLFVETAHIYKTLVLPVIATNTDIESIIDTLMENDYDGIVTEETNTDFIKNLSAALHNRGKQLIISAQYSEDLDIYEIESYIDKLIIKASDEEIESAILDIRLQVQEEKIIIEVSTDIEITELLDSYNVTPLTPTPFPNREREG